MSFINNLKGLTILPLEHNSILDNSKNKTSKDILDIFSGDMTLGELNDIYKYRRYEEDETIANEVWQRNAPERIKREFPWLDLRELKHQSEIRFMVDETIDIIQKLEISDKDREFLREAMIGDIDYSKITREYLFDLQNALKFIKSKTNQKYFIEYLRKNFRAEYLYEIEVADYGGADDIGWLTFIKTQFENFREFSKNEYKI